MATIKRAKSKKSDESPNKSRLAKRLPTLLFIISLITATLFMNIDRLNWQVSQYLNLRGCDEVTMIIKRFKPLSDAFPPCEVIGYATDLDARQDRVQYAKEFDIIRYALAPTFVVASPKQKMLVGNFHDPDRYEGILKELNLILIKDFGNGAMILRRVGK